MDKILGYIDCKKESHLNQLIEFLSIPSISSDPEYNEQTRKTANWVVEHLKSIGFDNARLYETNGHPIVYTENLEAGQDKQTVLIYGHYDVQPVDPIEEWDTPPFEPIIKNNKIFARGTSDDKGQVFCHIKALESHLKINGKLPVNVKLIIEGEEEAGSNHLDDFIRQNTELLKCDTILISDTEWFADGLPSLCYSLRGISYIEVTVIGPNRDLHSGTYGGAVDNPIMVLSQMIASLKDENNKITIPGFYDKVIELTDEEREGFEKLPFNYDEYCKDLDIEATNGEKGFTTLEQVWARPALDVNGIFGGYIGEGAKTVIPSKATAKISMRLVANQNPVEISDLICKHLVDIAPNTVKVIAKGLHGGSPVYMSKDSKGVKAATIALEKAFGTKPIFMREGGSIPIVALFQSELKAPSVLMGLGLPGDNIHSPNENFDLDNFFGGIKASAIFFEELSKL